MNFVRPLTWERLGEGFYLRHGSRVLATIAPAPDGSGWLWRGMGEGNRIPTDLDSAQRAALSHCSVVLRTADRAERRP